MVDGTWKMEDGGWVPFAVDRAVARKPRGALGAQASYFTALLRFAIT